MPPRDCRKWRIRGIYGLEPVYPDFHVRAAAGTRLRGDPTVPGAMRNVPIPRRQPPVAVRRELIKPRHSKKQQPDDEVWLLFLFAALLSVVPVNWNLSR